ncbi:unnamed protein product [Sphenostylis stenocarpa]|uniref:DC1 domain-containing protein n=1 Tax=Sphenostylis stenocarpa TaxID=92480 RepID=A0AA86RWS4_9FABA|nr:unnamed protein product [Sphenostylis stenocarpa]
MKPAFLREVRIPEEILTNLCHQGGDYASEKHSAGRAKPWEQSGKATLRSSSQTRTNFGGRPGKLLETSEDELSSCKDQPSIEIHLQRSQKSVKNNVKEIKFLMMKTPCSQRLKSHSNECEKMSLKVPSRSRYNCSLCDFDLHTHCSIPSPSLFHPFYPKCSFHFLSHPPGDTPRYCNACQKPVKGFLYHCFSCGFDLHPCCAKLPTVIGSDGNNGGGGYGNGVKLFLYRTVRSACHRCGQKGRGWSYRSSCKRYNLHVACVREMVVESWHEGGGLKSVVESGCHKGRGGKGGRVRRCCEVAGVALQVVVSAVLGDPTALIAGIVGSLVSRA